MHKDIYKLGFHNSSLNAAQYLCSKIELNVNGIQTKIFFIGTEDLN